MKTEDLIQEIMAGNKKIDKSTLLKLKDKGYVVRTTTMHSTRRAFYQSADFYFYDTGRGVAMSERTFNSIAGMLEKFSQSVNGAEKDIDEIPTLERGQSHVSKYRFKK